VGLLSGLREVEAEILEGQPDLAGSARGAEDGEHHVLRDEVADALLVEDRAADDERGPMGRWDN
jgi:hypothetical protein